jgi:CRP-like cAMP-binding protein
MTAPMPHPNLSANGLLAAMPLATLALLDKWSHEVLAQGHTCLSAGEPIRSVYFPISGMISLVISTETGDLIEAGMVGSEGAAGLQSVFGPRTAFTSAVVQISGTFYTIAADVLREAVHRSEEAQGLCIHYTELLWTEAQQLAVCNAAHEAARRLARWLLQCADRIGSLQVPLTQEFLGEMLGIRRTSVTLLAQELQARGIIRYSRGKIVIINRIALEACACECYRTTKELYREVSGHAQKQSAARAS